jgi:hypothetical protein
MAVAALRPLRFDGSMELKGLEQRQIIPAKANIRCSGCDQ